VTGSAVPLYVASVALTNTPFLTELEALNAAAGMAGRSPTASETGGQHMTLLELLAKALALKPEDVTSKLGLKGAEDKDVANAIMALPVQVQDVGKKLADAEAEVAALKAAPKPVICADVANALGVAVDADLTAVGAAILRLKAPSGAGALGVRTALGLAPDAKDQDVLNAIAVLSSSKRRTDAEELVAEAIKAGKVPPAHREFYLREALHDLGAATEVINALTPITTPSGLGGKGAAPGKGLTDDELKVAKQLGLKPEEMLAARA
jgi:phage I-like protein